MEHSLNRLSYLYKCTCYIIVIISFLFANQSQAENCARVPVSSELYSIINYGSGAALDVEGYSKDPLANILSWDYNGTANQHFYLHQLDNGYWTIQSQMSGMNLDVLSFSNSNGGNIVQWHPTNTDNQQWRLKQSTTGAFNVVARHSGKSITAAGSYNGANIYQNKYVSNDSQRWFFNPVNSKCGSEGEVSGYASIPGDDGLNTTTGGGRAQPVTVYNCDQLAHYAASNNPTVIHIPANATIDCRTAPRNQETCEIQCPDYQDPGKSIFRIPVGSQSCTSLGSQTNRLVYKTRNERRIHVGANTTISGLNRYSRIRGASLVVNGTKNVIIQNLRIEDVNPGLIEAGDGITVNGSSHVLLDHLRFSAISDGHVDMKDSKNLTLSWNRFEGYNSAVCGNQHHYTNLAQNTQVTFHHNFWNYTSGRNPKLTGRDTRAHLYNNLWKNVTYFAVSVSNEAQAKLENNYFENNSRPHWNEGTGYMNGNIDSNVYTGISRDSDYRDSGDWWTLSDTAGYHYVTDNAGSISPILDQRTGPQ